ncbi:MAG: hypothetical protein ACREJ2_02845 [Planctomycetota bacterium]
MTEESQTPDGSPTLPGPAAGAATAPGGAGRMGNIATAAIGFLAPLCFNVGYYLRADQKRNFIAGMDLVVVVLCLLALTRWRRIPALIRATPWTAWALILFAPAAYILTGVVGTHSTHDLWEFKIEFLKKWLGNYLEYLLLAPVLVALVIDGRKDRLAWLMRGMILAGLLAAATGCADFWNATINLDVDVRGLYDNRNLLGGVMALLVPMAAAVVLLDRCKWTQAAAALLMIFGLWCQTTAGALLGIVGGVFAVAAFAWTLRARLHRCPFKIAALGAIVIGTIGLSNLLSPRAKSSDSYTPAQIKADYRGYSLQPRSQLDAALESIAPWKYEDRTDAMSPKTRLSDRARRWQAQINLIRKEPFGCGTGLYQKDIGDFYGGPYSKPTERGDIEKDWGAESDEPGSFGMYEVVASEMGLWGLAICFAFVIAALARAAGRVMQADLPPPGALSSQPQGQATSHGAPAAALQLPFEVYAGLYAFAGLTGAALFGIFHDAFASRGPSGVVAVALGLTLAVSAAKPGPRA